MVTLLFSMVTYASSCDKLKVSGSDQWIPFAYSEGDYPNRTPVGIAYEVVALIAQDLNIPLTIQVGLPWARIEALLERGELDLLAGNYWNEERAKKWLVTEDFGEDEVRVFVKKEGRFPFHSLDDLKKKKGLMPFGVSFGQEFDSYKKNLNLDTVHLHQQMIKMLSLDRADYVILPLYSGVSKIKDLGYHGKIEALERPVNVNKVHLSLSRQSPCAGLLEQINEIIAQRKQDGTFSKIFAKYL